MGTRLFNTFDTPMSQNRRVYIEVKLRIFMKRKSLFVRLMGDSPRMRVLDYLLTERDLDFSKSDIAANAGVGRATLYRIWDEMIASGIVVYTRTIGTARLYKLDRISRQALLLPCPPS